MADIKPIPPVGARLLAVSGQEPNFVLWNYLVKQPIDDGWHNYADFDRVLSNGNLVTGTDGKKWLKATGYNGDQPAFTGNVYYEDRDVNWYDLPTELIPIPNVIGNLAAKAASISEIDLMWSNPDRASTELERSEDMNGPFTKVKSSTGEAVGWADKNLKANTQYFYRIRAVGASGSSPYGDTVTAITQTPPVPAPAPEPTPTVLSTNTYTPSPLPVTNVGSTTVKQNWLKDNELLVYGGGAVLLILIFLILMKKD